MEAGNKTELSDLFEDFQFAEKPNLNDIRQMLANFARERNWEQYHTPRNILLAMVGEVGELAELFQWRGEVKPGLPDWNSSEREALEHELSDVLLYLVRLAHVSGINLPKAVERKMELNKQKYPVERVKGDSRKYNEYKDYSGEGNGDPGHSGNVQENK